MQHQLEDILNNQTLIVQNQSEMIEKLNIIDSRLLNVEKYLIIQQNRLNQSPKTTLSPLTGKSSFTSTNIALHSKANSLLNKSKHSLFTANMAAAAASTTSSPNTSRTLSSSKLSLSSNDENCNNNHNHHHHNNNHNNENDNTATTNTTTLNNLIPNQHCFQL